MGICRLIEGRGGSTFEGVAVTRLQYRNPCEHEAGGCKLQVGLLIHSKNNEQHKRNYNDDLKY